MSYSIDLRERVVNFVESGGPISEVPGLYKVGRTTVYRWLVLKKETNSLAKRPLNRVPRKICRETLRQRIADNPDMLLREHAEYFGVCLQSISMALQSMGMTRKKRHHFTKNGKKIKERYI